MVPMPSPGRPAPQDPAERPYTITEVSKLFGVSVQAVHLWMKSGRLRPVTRTSRRGNYLISRAEVVRLLERAGREVPGLWQRCFAKVLVVDDDPGIRKLARAAGRSPAFPLAVETADCVEDGIIAAARFLPDVILLDTFFPPRLLSGEEGLAFIRRASLLRSAKVVALVPHPRLEARYRKCGADGVLLKPFSLSEFRSAVYRQIRPEQGDVKRLIDAAPAARPG